MIPGANLFNLATNLITPTRVSFRRFAGREKNEVLQWVSRFEDPRWIVASVQAVKRNAYKNLGLDFQKNYTKIWAPENIINVDRDHAGDEFAWNGYVHQIEENTRWYFIDGWAFAMGVEIRRATAADFPAENSP